MSPPRKPNADVFDYDDHVAWLTELFRHRRPGFNFSTFAPRVGIKSRGYFHNIVSGARPLTDEKIGKFAEALRLDEEEVAYLRALASARQAPTEEGRHAARVRAAGLRKVRLAERLNQQNAAYLSKWHFTAIREAWEKLGARPSAAWVAERLVRPVPIEEIEEAMEVIDRLGLAPGASASDVSTGHEPTVQIGVAWHEQMLELARHAVTSLPRHERFVDGVAFTASASKVAELKRKIQHMVQELNHEAAQDPHPADEVVVIEVAMFPILRFEPPIEG